MANPGAAVETKAEARRLYEQESLSNRIISKRVGIHHSTIGLWAKQENWTRRAARVEHIPDDVELEAARRRAERASAAQQIVWANRRAREADECGVDATRARSTAAGLLEKVRVGNIGSSDDARKWMAAAKDAALTYAILIDKAQLLSGAATSRADVELAAAPVLAQPDLSGVLEGLRETRLRLMPPAASL